MSDGDSILIGPPNTHPVDELFAVLSVDAKGNHGIVAVMHPNGGGTPMVVSERRIADMLWDEVLLRDRVFATSGMRFEMVRFERGQTVREAAPVDNKLREVPQ
jgi:hypothetical protein